MQVINGLSRWQLVHFDFGQDEVAASQTAVALNPNEAAGVAGLENVGYTMPWPGEVIGISLNLSAAGSAGTLTVVPTIDTTVTTDPSLAVTTAVVGTDYCKRQTNTFAKNAVIGCKLTTSAAWNGNGVDLIASVWVLLKIDSI